MLAKYAFLVLLGTTLLSGCQTRSPKNKKTFVANKSELRNLANRSNKKTAISNLRLGTLRDTALSLGARGGLARRANQINNILVRHEALLNRVFNFHGMLLDNNVLPPILTEARKTLNLAGPEVIRISERNYQILHQARFVTAPPSWRDYLWLNFTLPEMPDKTLLPRSSSEQLVWQKYIDEGWEAGLNQAYSILTENLNRLVRDYTGMIRYRSLLAQNMVSLPFVATMNLGITGNNENMTIDDKILRITALPSLQAASQNWKTEITPNE